MGSWPSDPAVQAYVEERLKRGIYKEIGAFHLSATQVDAPKNSCTWIKVSPVVSWSLSKGCGTQKNARISKACVSRNGIA